MLKTAKGAMKIYENQLNKPYKKARSKYEATTRHIKIEKYQIQDQLQELRNASGTKVEDMLLIKQESLQPNTRDHTAHPG